ncbi:MAG: protein kinase [Gemmataceae bacterium]|nr:protein kinase [Gemmataceae bacterium]
MPIDSVKELVHVLGQYPLLEQGQRDELDYILKAQYTDPRILCKELVLRDWLTPFQVNQMFQGRVGELMLGGYVLQERLTEGAIGQLFKARHQHMKRVATVQVIRADLLKNPEAVERFYNEIHIVGLLSHANIVAAYDAGPVGNTHFFAMEFLEGIDLERLVQQSGPLPVDHACDYVYQAANGLQHAYERRLLHHDLKPSNLLLTRPAGPVYAANSEGAGKRSGKNLTGGTPIIKIRNLGLTLIRQHTRHTRVLAATNVEADAAAGADFTAPERASGHPGDVRSELYSLGCTFYFLLSGQVPFPGGTAAEKLNRHQTEEPVPIEVLRPETPAEVTAIVHRLMAKNPNDRYQTPAQVAQALSNSVLPVAQAAPTEPAAERGPPSSHRRMHPDALRRWRRGVLAGCAVLAVVIVVFAWLLFGPAGQPGPGTQVAQTTEPQNRPGQLRVLAGQPWVDTHVDVQPGQPILVRAEGKWRRGSKEADCTADGIGTLPRERNLVQDYPAMALLGRIENGPPLLLGTSKTFDPRAAGRLFVQANDLDLKDTSGSLNVEINGGKPGLADAPIFQVGYGDFDPHARRLKSFTPMPYWPAPQMWSLGADLADPKVNWMYWRGPDGHTGPNAGRSIVRRWLLERDGFVTIVGTLSHMRDMGDGVRAHVISSRLGSVGGPWIAHNKTIETKVDRVEVRRGDVLHLVVDPRADHSQDAFSWPAAVQFSEKF